MGTQGVSQCFGCGVVGDGQVDIDDGDFYCFACWLAYYAARVRSPNLRARLLQAPAHVQPARNLQGVASAPGSAQHDRGVGDVSLTFGRRPQLQRPQAAHAVKPSSLKSEVGILVRTPTPVTALWRRVTRATALWRGVRNTSTKTLLRRRIQQTARMGPMRKCGNALGERARKRAG